MRIGIFGGFFNPPHLGHLVCAQEALWQLELDSVVLMPLGEPPHRSAAGDPGRERRYALCRAAVEGADRFDVSRAEIERPGPSYTVDTLRELHERSPNDELHFVMGADQAAALPDWHEPREVIRLARLAVASRDGIEQDDVRAAVAALGRQDRVTFFDMPGIDISSTMVRERVAAGRPIRYLVPEGVARLIREQGLYRERAA